MVYHFYSKYNFNWDLFFLCQVYSWDGIIVNTSYKQFLFINTTIDIAKNLMGTWSRRKLMFEVHLLWKLLKLQINEVNIFCYWRKFNRTEIALNYICSLSTLQIWTWCGLSTVSNINIMSFYSLKHELDLDFLLSNMGIMWALFSQTWTWCVPSTVSNISLMWTFYSQNMDLVWTFYSQTWTCCGLSILSNMNMMWTFYSLKHGLDMDLLFS